MKELTEAQYEKIGNAVFDRETPGEGRFGVEREVGRAAYAASFPYAVAEALQPPSDTPTERDSEGVVVRDKESLRRFLRHRLACLTAKPDPAVEAVWQRLRMQNCWPHPDSEESQKLKVKAREIVDLVRSADGVK